MSATLNMSAVDHARWGAGSRRVNTARRRKVGTFYCVRIMILDSARQHGITDKESAAQSNTRCGRRVSHRASLAPPRGYTSVD
jgi:hypothetical protein